MPIFNCPDNNCNHCGTDLCICCPNGYESFDAGDTIEVKWQAPYNSTDYVVNVTLYKGNEFAAIIAEYFNAHPTSYYRKSSIPWTIPTFLEQRDDYRIKVTIIAGDNLGQSDFSDNYFEIVNTINQPPVADAGDDQTVVENSIVQLDASGSYDPDGDTITYAWSAPVGITLTNANSVNPIFTAPEVTEDTEYQFILVVNDGEFDSSQDAVTITVENFIPNQAPTADAGEDQDINEGMFVTLDGTGSFDPEGSNLTYTWTAPVGITLSNVNAVSPTFTAPNVDDDTPYSFTLEVSDGDLTDTDDVTITVLNVAVPQPPVADAGDNQTVDEGDLVTLDGSGSYDPEGEDVTYMWTAPDGITLSDQSIVNPTFTAPEVISVTDYIFTLTVEDPHGLSDTDNVTITVNPVADPPVLGGQYNYNNDDYYTAVSLIRTNSGVYNFTPEYFLGPGNPCSHWRICPDGHEGANYDISGSFPFPEWEDVIYFNHTYTDIPSGDLLGTWRSYVKYIGDDSWTEFLGGLEITQDMLPQALPAELTIEASSIQNHVNITLGDDFTWMYTAGGVWSDITHCIYPEEYSSPYLLADIVPDQSNCVNYSDGGLCHNPNDLMAGSVISQYNLSTTAYGPYNLELTIRGMTQGSITCRLGLESPSATFNSNGTHSGNIEASSLSPNTFYIYPTPDFNGIIDNVSLKLSGGGDELISNGDFSNSLQDWSGTTCWEHAYFPFPIPKNTVSQEDWCVNTHGLCLHTFSDDVTTWHVPTYYARGYLAGAFSVFLGTSSYSSSINYENYPLNPYELTITCDVSDILTVYSNAQFYIYNNTYQSEALTPGNGIITYTVTATAGNSANLEGNWTIEWQDGSGSTLESITQSVPADTFSPPPDFGNVDYSLEHPNDWNLTITCDVSDILTEHSDALFYIYKEGSTGTSIQPNDNNTITYTETAGNSTDLEGNWIIKWQNGGGEVINSTTCTVSSLPQFEDVTDNLSIDYNNWPATPFELTIECNVAAIINDSQYLGTDEFYISNSNYSSDPLPPDNNDIITYTAAGDEGGLEGIWTIEWQDSEGGLINSTDYPITINHTLPNFVSDEHYTSINYEDWSGNPYELAITCDVSDILTEHSDALFYIYKEGSTGTSIQPNDNNIITYTVTASDSADLEGNWIIKWGNSNDYSIRSISHQVTEFPSPLVLNTPTSDWQVDYNNYSSNPYGLTITCDVSDILTAHSYAQFYIYKEGSTGTSIQPNDNNTITYTETATAGNSANLEGDWTIEWQDSGGNVINSATCSVSTSPSLPTFGEVEYTIIPDLSVSPVRYDFSIECDVDDILTEHSDAQFYIYNNTYQSGALTPGSGVWGKTTKCVIGYLAENELEGTWTIEWRNSGGEVINFHNEEIDQDVIQGVTLDGTTYNTPQGNSFYIQIPGGSSPYKQNTTDIGPIQLQLTQYETTKTWTSPQPYNSDTGVSMLSLHSYDLVPFTTGDRETWLKYEIVTEGGDTYPITPVNRPGQYPVIYNVNSTLPEELRSDRQQNFNEGFIDQKVFSWKVRITMLRPGNEVNRTPIVYTYRMRYYE